MSILPMSKGQSAADISQFPPVGTGAGKSIPTFDLYLQAIEQGYLVPISFIALPRQPRA